MTLQDFLLENNLATKHTGHPDRLTINEPYNSFDIKLLDKDRKTNMKIKQVSIKNRNIEIELEGEK